MKEKLLKVTHQTVPDWRAAETLRARSISRVKTAAVSPYSELLALSMASSCVLNFMMHWTGPKIWQTDETQRYSRGRYRASTQSGEALYLFSGDAHVIFDIREDGGLNEQTSVLQRTSTDLQPGSLLLPAVHQLQNLLKLPLVNLTVQHQWRNQSHSSSCVHIYTSYFMSALRISAYSSTIT